MKGPLQDETRKGGGRQENTADWYDLVEEGNWEYGIASSLQVATSIAGW